jgi:hypothetical protein
VRIDTYRFGRMVIDGTPYTKDLRIVRGAVLPAWWREAGSHVFAPEDLAEVIAAAPEVVVLGTGFFGLVEVREDALRAFAEAGAEVVTERTARAVATFNRLTSQGRKVSAAFHLTC